MAYTGFKNRLRVASNRSINQWSTNQYWSINQSI